MQLTFEKLKSDPTNNFKKEFVRNLKDLKDRKVINYYVLHMKLYPSVDQSPRFYGSPKTPEEELRSYNVSTLFRALVVIKDRLVNDVTLKNGTLLSPEEITKLLELCLKSIYFSFQDHYYLQTDGAATESLVSLIVCNLYMKDFERRPLESAAHPPRWWKRYIDDTHTVFVKTNAQEFTDHLNSIDGDIKKTTEG